MNIEQGVVLVLGLITLIATFLILVGIIDTHEERDTFQSSLLAFFMMAVPVWIFMGLFGLVLIFILRAFA